MKLISSLTCLLILFSGKANSQVKSSPFLEDLLLTDTNSNIQQLLRKPDSFYIQIIYTKIDRNEKNEPRFKNYYFNTDRELYYYPASTVKLPLAILSLEKLNRIKITGVNKYTRLQYDSSYSGQKSLYKDSSAENGYPSIAQFIRKAFLISDNDAYNRMYEFVGQEEINRRMHEQGFPEIRIVRQFMPLNENENRHTNPVSFLNSKNQIIYMKPAAFNKDSFNYSPVVRLGRGYLDSKDSLILQPMNFTRQNRIPLEDLQQILQRLLFPLSFPKYKRFSLKEDDYAFLYRYLSQYPSETPFPKYDTSVFFNSYVKFYFLKGGNQIPDYIRVFNKVGWAYGFLTDVSYIVDFKNKIEFMITATVYTNADGILNDNQYEYESVGLPFLYRVGQDLYQYELHRGRKYRPDLRKFRLKYEQRDLMDNRPSIKEVDN